MATTALRMPGPARSGVVDETVAGMAAAGPTEAASAATNKGVIFQRMIGNSLSFAQTPQRI